MPKKSDARQALFVSSFIASLAILVFFLGASALGYVIYPTTFYCESGVCGGFCEFDEDCPESQVCCTVLDFGVCKPALECSTPYEDEPFVYEPWKLPSPERPLRSRHNYAGLYLALIIAVLAVGAVNFSRTRH